MKNMALRNKHNLNALRHYFVNHPKFRNVGSKSHSFHHNISSGRCIRIHFKTIGSELKPSIIDIIEYDRGASKNNISIYCADNIDIIEEIKEFFTQSLNIPLDFNLEDYINREFKDTFVEIPNSVDNSDKFINWIISKNMV